MQVQPLPPAGAIGQEDAATSSPAAPPADGMERVPVRRKGVNAFFLPGVYHGQQGAKCVELPHPSLSALH